MFESKQLKNKRESLEIVDERGALTKQESQILKNYKKIEPENNPPVEYLTYPDAKNDQYDSQEFEDAKTKSYEAVLRIAPRPDVETKRVNSSVLMVPKGPGAGPMSIRSNRNQAAVSGLIVPAIQSAISEINSKAGALKTTEISITLTTQKGNDGIADIKNRILAIYPKAKVSIEYTPNFKSQPGPGQQSSTEDFGYKVEAKGYK